MWKNTENKYGRVSKLFHWFTVITFFSMFALGFWMVDLTYYSEWYQTAPHWHESAGILLFFATIVRLLWRKLNVHPKAIETHSTFVKKSSAVVHALIYILLLVVMMSGYFISSADDRPIEIFNWFELFSLGELYENQEDIAGTVHEYIAYSLVILTLAHALSALKHHFVDKDLTLTRMLK